MEPKFSFLELVKSRISIRRFSERPVTREDIEICLEAARVAPSAENAQPWRFVVIDDPAIKDPFARQVFSGIYGVSKFAARAPVLIIILAKLNVITHRIGRQIQNVSFHLIDIGIAGEHLILQAEELGLGTCWIGWFDVRKARKFFKVPKKYRIISLIALGHYDEKSTRERKRKPHNEIIFYNRMPE
jgi:nitroreductase